MPLPVFQAACAVIIVLTLLVNARNKYTAGHVEEALFDSTGLAGLLFYLGAVGGVVSMAGGADLATPSWLVVMSARSVGLAVFATPSSPLVRAGMVGALVAFDASLVEVVAVRAGLWSWAEPGHLGVPVIGILGWGFFAGAADLVLGRRWRWRHLLLPLLGPLFTHGLIVVAWWALFRHSVRGSLGPSSVAVMLGIGALAAVLVIRARQQGGVIPLGVALPRMIAASLFVALLLTTAPLDRSLWLHTLAVALPYLAATSLRA